MKPVWSIWEQKPDFSLESDGPCDNRINKFASFSEAMESLKEFPGNWYCNWTREEIGKGNHYLILEYV